ncbi:hypothetical protein [Thiocapsa roseopersicina]|uniref:Uncharacterized protein n=1 Tax=Thiocapsa roseopersicina TaxID=1058 RepID=A0A1H2RNJ3_THIRO|nr:hypothetical protein [Thiocapsa roseopersicina]SDW21001.1 hypothetical protein SAMN05421783_102108 [Thiocapsa roseopersicina]
MTPANLSPSTLQLALIGLIGLALVGPSTVANAQPSTRPEVDPATAPQVDPSSLRALEQRVEELERRVERMGSAPSSGGSASAPSKTGDIHWSFDAALSRDPFNVKHQSFDRGSGRFDVLLKVVAPIPDPTPWQVPSGAPVPVAARIGLADGTASESLVFRLARGPRLEPGAILHIEAQVPPEQAAAISGLSVGIRRE